MWKICIINGNNYQRAKTGVFRGNSVLFDQNPDLGFFELYLDLDRLHGKSGSRLDAGKTFFPIRNQIAMQQFGIH